MNISNDSHPRFRTVKPRSNLYRSLLWIGLIIIGVAIIRDVRTGVIRPLLMPTPTPTRTFQSLEQEADTYFTLGKVDCQLDENGQLRQDCAIAVLEEAVSQDPENAHLLTELARVQTYSMALLTTTDEKYERMNVAMENARRAVELAPDDSEANAVYAFTLDWLSTLPSNRITQEQREEWLVRARTHAEKAINLDQNNLLAIAIYAEIQVDLYNLDRAMQFIRQGIAQEDPANPQMDLHRVYAYVLESYGDYETSLQEYEKAVEITPNLTFLHIKVGQMYRHLKDYSTAMTWFERAATINTQLDIKDPTPYIELANTYINQPNAEFFAAIRNVRKALDMNYTSPAVYAKLGIIYHRARNYEGAILAFKCGLRGCTAEESCEVRQCNPDVDPMVAITGMPLDKDTLAFYVTYGSVLAGMHKPSRPYCDEAMKVFQEIRVDSSDDETIMNIVVAGEEICTSAGYGPLQ